jgi:sugar lactone lactonase YvrE
VRGTKVYVADTAYHVVRVIDRGAGDAETVLAGTGVAGSTGDGGPATAATLETPSGTAAASDGSVFVVDADANKVRRIDATGVITTVAGTGDAGFSGDGGPATAAQLDGPTGIAVDSAAPANLYIADQLNQRVRKVDTTGTISTIAGTGFQGSGLPGPATQSDLNDPSGIAVDVAGDVYVADTGNSRVQKVSGGNIFPIAGGLGSGYEGDGGPALAAAMRGPTGVALDNAVPPNIYVLDTFNRVVRRVDGVTTIITTVAGNGTFGYSGDGGPGTAAQLATAPPGVSGAFSYGVAADDSGRVLVADIINARVRQVESGTITTFAGTGRRCCYSLGTGPAALAQLGFPAGMASDGAGGVYVAEQTNNRVRHVDAGGVISTVAGTGVAGSAGDGGPATAAQLNAPFSVARDRNGNLYVADNNNNRVTRVDSSGVSTTVAGTGAPGFSGDGGPATASQLNGPSGVAVDAAGALVIGDTGNHRVRRVDSAGVITTVAGTGAYGFSGDGGPATAAKLSLIYGVAVDTAGGILISDSGNHRVRRVSADGVISAFAGAGVAGSGGDGGPARSAQLRSPAGMAVDGAGEVFIADFGAHRVRKVDRNGVISTIAGSGLQGFSGDGGSALAAALDTPAGVAVGSGGAVYVADSGNSRVRVVTGAAATVHSVADFDGDGASDISVFRPSSGTWFSATGTALGWGAPGDLGVPGDYDGDGRADEAVFRPSTGLWALHQSLGGDVFLTYGVGSDLPVPADYDGDGKTDIAVYRPSVGTWYVHRSSDGVDTAVTFGGADGDIPVPADYDGDGRADLAIVRSGNWFVHPSSGAADTATSWGTLGDVPVATDYDGDGHADIAIFRPSTGLWAIHPTSGAADVAVTYGGLPGDVPVAGDYDGDGRSDIAIFRPSTGAWFEHVGGISPTGADTVASFGLATDVPLSLPYAVRHLFF